jgi:predicted RNase H-like nuclease (RuvC/YqgF family)
MDWLIWVSLGALLIGVWHEINRFPATGESILKLQERLDELESGNRDLREKVESLDDEVLSLSNEIDRIKDPAYHQALEDGDGHALYEMDKARGNV